MSGTVRQGNPPSKHPVEDSKAFLNYELLSTDKQRCRCLMPRIIVPASSVGHNAEVLVVSVIPCQGVGTRRKHVHSKLVMPDGSNCAFRVAWTWTGKWKIHLVNHGDVSRSLSWLSGIAHKKQANRICGCVCNSRILEISPCPASPHWRGILRCPEFPTLWCLFPLKNKSAFRPETF